MKDKPTETEERLLWRTDRISAEDIPLDGVQLVTASDDSKARVAAAAQETKRPSGFATRIRPEVLSEPVS